MSFGAIDKTMMYDGGFCGHRFDGCHLGAKLEQMWSRSKIERFTGFYAILRQVLGY